MSMTPLPPLDPSSPTFRTDVDAFFRSRMPSFVTEANAMQANLNALAAGGAYALSFVAVAQASVGSAAGGKMTFFPNTASQAGATALWLDVTDASGANVARQIDSIASGTAGTVKATVKITKLGDPARFVVFDITSIATLSNYKALTVQTVDYAPVDTPFAAGDMLLMQFQRSGDKGSAGLNQSAKFSDRQSAGVAGGTGTASTFAQVRALNTVEWNTMGAAAALGGSYGANVFVLQPGTYGISGRVPGLQCGGHKAAIFDESGNTFFIMGSSAYSSATGGQSDSTLSGYFTLTVAKAFTVRHFLSAIGSASPGATLGSAAGGGQIETYTEITITKYA